MLKKLLFTLFLFSLIPIIAVAYNEKPLQANQAFKLYAEATQTNAIKFNWEIAKDYYLYKDHIKFKVLEPSMAVIGSIFMPLGIEQHNESLGKYRVYANSLNLIVPILNPEEKPMKLLVTYQGCAKWGFCYPPIIKLVTINSSAFLKNEDIVITNYNAPAKTERKPQQQITTTALPTQEQSEQSKIDSLLLNSSIPMALLLFFGLGLLLTFTPCVLPMIPILSSIIVGHGKKLSKIKALGLSSTYVIAMSLSFAITGVLAGWLGSSIQVAMQTPFAIILISVVFIILALSLFGFYNVKPPQIIQQRINNTTRKQKAGSYLGVFIMGILSTLIVSPCVTAPLIGALTYISNTGNALFGGAALFIMGLGMGLPLLIIGTSFGHLLPRAGHWMQSVNAVFGVILLGLAIWMLERILPGPLTLFLWAALIVVSAVYMGALSKTPENPWGKLWKGLGIVLLTYGLILVLGSALGNSDIFNPLHLNKQNPLYAMTDPNEQSQLSFFPVQTATELQRQIKIASKQNKPIMLDFYADWCIACLAMEKYTFSDPTVKLLLKQFILLKADVTQQNDSDKKLMKQFGIIGPPAIVFFNQKGDELKNNMIVGEVSAREFSKHLQSLIRQLYR